MSTGKNGGSKNDEEEFERERLDNTRIWFCERLMEIRLVLSGNVYSL